MLSLLFAVDYSVSDTKYGSLESGQAGFVNELESGFIEPNTTLQRGLQGEVGEVAAPVAPPTDNIDWTTLQPGITALTPDGKVYISPIGWLGKYYYLEYGTFDPYWGFANPTTLRRLELVNNKFVPDTSYSTDISFYNQYMGIVDEYFVFYNRYSPSDAYHYTIVLVGANSNKEIYRDSAIDATIVDNKFLVVSDYRGVQVINSSGVSVSSTHLRLADEKVQGPFIFGNNRVAFVYGGVDS
ncbi:Uncharacterized [Syntrophomonas zehnderi OL-4]|uniref:Uncharacterized n=1 Tax=Syntrophomonas zehnderi OL-4 TaxID=690567 RepID=A0A0E4GAJ8_9FIRM|nr:hypothetical protein [Syntrophomonas zehnderi]CFX14619.1 Uncharacterized [Syntrophomonas zehnderi OL-4]